jgi:hypothetical protein
MANMKRLFETYINHSEFSELELYFYHSMFIKNCDERIAYNQIPYSCFEEYLDIHRKWLKMKYTTGGAI